MTEQITVSRELLRQAMELLEGAITYDWHGNPSEEFDRECNTTTTVLRTALEQPAVEPASHQYQDSSGKWCNFMNESHYVNTKADGRWPIRALYTAPQAQQPEGEQR